MRRGVRPATSLTSPSAVTIGIVAGEASGDALGAIVIAAVRARIPEVRFVGISGPRMEAAGCEGWYPIERLSIRGVVEVLTRLPELVRMRSALARRLLAASVQVFIGIDAPDFNLGLERRLKREGVRTLHLVSPSVWAWRRERIGRIAQSVDRMLALFPFEHGLYEGSGVDVTFVGHPLAQAAAGPLSRRDARQRLRLAKIEPVLALLPGSRIGELDMHADLLLDAAAAIFAERPEFRFVVPLATRATRDRFETALANHAEAGLPVTLLYGHATDALQAADVALVASGTATLEAALARCPHVIFYRVNSLTARLVRGRLLLPWVGLPNVLAERFVVPELLQEDATPINLAQAVMNLYDDTLTRRRIEALFAGLSEALRADTGGIAARVVTEELSKVGVAC